MSIMNLENTGIENLTADFHELTELLKSHGFAIGGHWDYEHVIYDKKIIKKDDTYYLRIRGNAIEGDIGGRYATVQLINPILVKHLFPHGIDYGDDGSFAKSVIEQCNGILKQVRKSIETIQVTN